MLLGLGCSCGCQIHITPKCRMELTKRNLKCRYLYWHLQQSKEKKKKSNVKSRKVNVSFVGNFPIGVFPIFHLIFLIPKY